MSQSTQGMVGAPKSQSNAKSLCNVKQDHPKTINKTEIPK